MKCFNNSRILPHQTDCPLKTCHSTPTPDRLSIDDMSFYSSYTECFCIELTRSFLFEFLRSISEHKFLGQGG